MYSSIKIVIALLFISFGATAQTYQFLGTPLRVVDNRGYFMSDSGNRAFTPLDTISASYLSAADKIGDARLKNDTPYIRLSTNWIRLMTSSANAFSDTPRLYTTTPLTSTASNVLRNSVASALSLGTLGATFTTNSLGVTQTTTSGISLTNNTAAAAGAQQISPAINWNGFGWKTDATAESRPVGFRAYMLPVQGTSNPSASLLFQSSINGGAYATMMTITSGGDITSANDFIATSRVRTATLRDPVSNNNYMAITGTSPNNVITWGNTGMLTTNFVSKVSGGTFNFDNRICSSLAIPTVASAGDLVLTGGNTFYISGTTTINAIAISGWNQAADIDLIFLASLTVKNNTAGGAGTAKFSLQGAVDFAATAGDVLTLKWDASASLFREKSRSIN